MEDNSKKIKLIVILSLCLVIGLVGYFSYQTISRNGKVTVSVRTLPDDATVLIDNKSVGHGTIYITPGEHRVTIKKDGFKTYEDNQTFKVPSGIIDIGLIPQSAEAKKWANEHQNDYLLYEGRAGERAISSSKSFSDINPIATKLPYKNLLFTIGYFADPLDSSGNTIIVTISAPEGYRQAAINKIKEWGFEPSKLTIIFKQYENPFSS